MDFKYWLHRLNSYRFRVYGNAGGHYQNKSHAKVGLIIGTAHKWVLQFCKCSSKYNKNFGIGFCKPDQRNPIDQ
jgi:hypothetical protein